MATDTTARPPEEVFVGGKHDVRTVGDLIAHVPLAERPTPKQWWFTFGVAFLGVLLFTYAVGYLLIWGVGIWGINVPTAWGFAIINFVWWIGIGHAGTLISAILLLLHQKWRTSINRFSEAMTLFAVMCAGMFPILHMGRPWFAYWLYPFPNHMGVWPQFRSPLAWDVFAVTTYFTVSLVFWYVGLIPDFATLRDRARTKLGKIAFGIFSLGWRGSAIHWRRYEKVYLMLAGISTPLVLSVHTVVSFDFAVSIVPLWHATIFPPFFVAGAIFSGFAMVIFLAIPVRKWFGIEELITRRHIDLCAKVMFGTGMLVCYGYFSEVWMGWYSHSIYERQTTWQRLFGPYGWSYWALITCNFIVPQLLWSKKIRYSDFWLMVISFIVLIGMWFERYVIVITLTREYLPSMWGRYSPTFWDWATFIGTLGFFTMMFMLFCRFVPMISMNEIKEMLPRKAGGRDGHSIMENAPVSDHDDENGTYGLLAEFADGDTLTDAIHKAKAEGYTVMDAYTPYPVSEAIDALGFPKSEMGTVMFIGGLTGATAGFLMQWFLSTQEYAINVAGRPLNSWPQFIPVTFEMMVLTTALTGLFALMALCGLPQYYHPLFNVPSFARATRDRFFLCVEAEDPKFDLARTREFLQTLQPLEVAEVPK